MVRVRPANHDDSTVDHDADDDDDATCRPWITGTPVAADPDPQQLPEPHVRPRQQQHPHQLHLQRRRRRALAVFLTAAVCAGSWVLGHFYQDSTALCFADRCNNAREGHAGQTRRSLALFFALLVATAGVGAVIVAFGGASSRDGSARSTDVVARVAGAARRLLTARAGRRATKAAGEVAWFAVALVVVVVAIPAASWGSAFAEGLVRVAAAGHVTGSATATVVAATFDGLAVVSGYAAAAAVGLAL
ncbi:hypothetical protein HK405_005161, partial [Cladochytrium tenue]